MSKPKTPRATESLSQTISLPPVVLTENPSGRMTARTPEEILQALDVADACDVLDMIGNALTGSEAGRHLPSFDQSALDAALAEIERYGRFDAIDGAFQAYEIGSLATWGAIAGANVSPRMSATWGLKQVKKELARLIGPALAADRIPLQFAPYEGPGYVDKHGEYRTPSIHWTEPGCRELVFVTLPADAANRIEGAREVIVLEYFPPTYIPKPTPHTSRSSAALDQPETDPQPRASQFIDPDAIGTAIVAEMTETDAGDAVTALRQALSTLRTHNAPPLDEEEAERISAARNTKRSYL